ncbi:MAG: HNH endonuclease signature motif containing protein [bacterium]|nr:HNH endonuclease signature motif containing protein [bacterium]
MGSVPRKTSTRDRHRRILKARRGPCGICKQPIDYRLPYLHPMEFVADHIIPLIKGGPDTLANKQSAHRSCNRAKGDQIESELKAMTELVKRVRTY